MNNRVLLILAVLLVILFSSCSKDSSPTNVSQSPIKTELLNYSFEKNNAGSIEGWRLSDTLVGRRISFSNDVPNSGGSYSLAVQPDSGESTYLTYTIIPAPSVLKKRFSFSFNSKILNPNSLITYMDIWFYTPNGVEGSYGVGLIKADQWRNVSNISDTISLQIDSLKVEISVPTNNSNSRYYYDNIRIIEEEYN